MSIYLVSAVTPILHFGRYHLEKDKILFSFIMWDLTVLLAYLG